MTPFNQTIKDLWSNLRGQGGHWRIDRLHRYGYFRIYVLEFIDETLACALFYVDGYLDGKG